MEWWQLIWEKGLDVGTFTFVVASFVQIKMTLHQLVAWRKEHEAADAKWKESHGERQARTERDLDHLINDCPIAREKRLHRDRMGG